MCKAPVARAIEAATTTADSEMGDSEMDRNPHGILLNTAVVNPARKLNKGRSQSWSGDWVMDTTGTNQVNAKLVLLGDMGAGKSSLVMRFVKVSATNQRTVYGGIPTEDPQESTVGAAFLTQSLAVNETTVKFEIWDTAGQERYHSLAPMYYRGAAAAIVVYDITNPDSFVRAKKWVNELQRQGNSNLVIALAGNKADLARRRQVEPEEGQAYADEYELFFMETSAKTALNVNELFYEIARMLPKTQKVQNEGMVLTDKVAERAAKQSSCCS